MWHPPHQTPCAESYVQSDLAYPVLSYPDPSPSAEANRWLPIYSMCHTYMHPVCVFDYPVLSPIRISLLKTVVCGSTRSDCALGSLLTLDGTMRGHIAWLPTPWLQCRFVCPVHAVRTCSVLDSRSTSCRDGRRPSSSSSPMPATAQRIRTCRRRS